MKGRKLLSGILAGVMLLGLTACGSTGGSGGEEKAKDPDEKLAVTEVEDESRIFTKGPNGEEGCLSETIILTDEQKAAAKKKKLTLAVVLPYTDDDRSVSQRQGIADACEELDIEIIETASAGGSVSQQIKDIDSVIAKDPDILLTVPVDAKETADAYRRAKEAGIKIVFTGAVAEGLKAGEDYLTCVASDAYGNGAAAARILGDAMGKKGNVVMLSDATGFFAASQCEAGFQAVLKDEYPDIQIVDSETYTNENAVSEPTKTLLKENEDIDGIFASSDVALDGAYQTMKKRGRTEGIHLAADGLGNNIALEIAKGNVAGVGAARPYDQGVTAVRCAVQGILEDEVPAFVCCPALSVTKENLAESYKEVYHTDVPQWLTEAMGDSDN